MAAKKQVSPGVAVIVIVLVLVLLGGIGFLILRPKPAPSNEEAVKGLDKAQWEAFYQPKQGGEGPGTFQGQGPTGPYGR